MKTKTAKVLPKTVDEISNGGVYLQQVRCGKKTCKCARGEMHSAYYFFTRQNGKLVKTYVSKKDVEIISSLSNQSRAARGQNRQLAQYSSKLLKRIRETVRECEAHFKIHKESETDD